MKKSILRSVFMALMALLWTANAQAENYGFEIGHKRVTSENYTNISAEGGFPDVLGGKVTYNPQTKTLTLEEASIKDFSLFTLNGCEIIQPSGGVYDYLKNVVSKGYGYSPTKDWVIISNPTSLEEVTADVPVKMEGTYNLQGMKMQGTFDSLPKGIYIHNGKKVVKK